MEHYCHTFVSNAALSLDAIESGAYVLVEYASKKSTRHFVGQVMEIKQTDVIDEEEYKVLFIRKKDDSG